MKTIILVISIVITGIVIQAQECNDIVYPIDGESIIFDCCVLEVKYGNIVYYVKNEQHHIIDALKIVKDGQTVNLKPYKEDPIEVKNKQVEPRDTIYNGHDYNYYRMKYKGAKTQRNIGMFMTITGATANIISVVLVADNNPSNDATATGLNVYGIIAFNVGLPLWISGGVKRGNNRRAMQRTQSTSYQAKSLSFGITTNGVGLIFCM